MAQRVKAPTAARILKALYKSRSQAGLETSGLVALVNKGTRYKLGRPAVYAACRRLNSKDILDSAVAMGNERVWWLTESGKRVARNS